MVFCRKTIDLLVERLELGVAKLGQGRIRGGTTDELIKGELEDVRKLDNGVKTRNRGTPLPTVIDTQRDAQKLRELSLGESPLFTGFSE